MKRIKALLLCLLLWPLPACAQDSGWMVLVYMVGSSLETDHGAASTDIEEMLAASLEPGAPDIYVCTGGSSAWDDCSVWRIKQGEQTLLASLGDRSMGESDTLRRFIQTVPAEGRSALILWNHGYGAAGFGWDERHNDLLTLPEIRAALTGGPVWELIGMDACLMASMELLSAVEGQARYLAASQEAEPAEGWDYRLLARLNETENGREAGKLLACGSVERWLEPYAAWPDYAPPLCVSVLDASRLSAVREAAAPFLERLNDGLLLGGFPLQSRIREQTAEAGRYSMATRYDCVDLADLCSRYAGQLPQESAALLTALDGLIVERAGNASLCGVSLYLPQGNEALYQQLDMAEVAFCGEQLALVETYVRCRAASSAAYESMVQPLAGADDIAFALTPAQQADFAAASAVLYAEVEPDTYAVYGTVQNLEPDETGMLHYAFQNRALWLVSQGERAVLPLLDLHSQGDVARARAYAVLAPRLADDGLYQPGSMQNVLLDMVLTPDGAQLTGLQSVEALSTGKSALHLEDFGEIWLSGGGYTASYGEDGSVLPFEAWTYAPMMTVATLPITADTALLTAPYPEDEKLYVQFQVLDVYGQTHASDLIQVQ